ncbi:MAG: response regulator transcription factor, partial [Betaproteobacteria bacterium]|nr:response regulator transcription factor [Betaproteobacteria bacterium]
MPEMTGVDVAKSLLSNRELRCHVVFVTAFDQYAVEAFDSGAIDYVLKPYSDERLATAVTRLKERLSAVPPPPAQNLEALLAHLSAKLSPQGERLKWIKANIGSNLRLIPIDEVLFFQSDEKYTLVATKEFDALIKTPIKELLDGLDVEKFWQIHRSTIVNATAIEAVSRDFRGQATVKVKGRKENLTVSRPFSHLFKQM